MHLDRCTLSGLANLTRASTGWARFLETHKEAVYARKVDPPLSAEKRRGLPCQPCDSNLASKLYQNVTSWKDLVRRQRLLALNWQADVPVYHESLIGAESPPAWRCRVDYARRLLLCTQRRGGLSIYDLDNGDILNYLDPTIAPAYAHLEYDQGYACWNSWLDPIEVWRHDDAGLKRGHFHKVAVLDHDQPTRGFMLRWPSLCVISDQGKAYVWNLTNDGATLINNFAVHLGAVGHLTQNDELIMVTFAEGYHFWSILEGRYKGMIRPTTATSEVFHLEVPAEVLDEDHEPSKLGDFARLPLLPGSINAGSLIALEDDEWGAGVIEGSVMVGTSKQGRILVCPDWRAALCQGQGNQCKNLVIEHRYNRDDGSQGGWLSIRDKRIAFQVEHFICVYQLEDLNKKIDRYNTIQAWRVYDRSGHIGVQGSVSCLELGDDCLIHVNSNGPVGFRRSFGGPHGARILDLGTGLIQDMT
ncbi:MAG: hypothetical protein M1828_002145 [Chrysothrix sp. TS-e1954]|nr:MAG: hypothetical protein M1828_002145 [Chrysothrix sp. TS-e1954]